jgi:hypothetical protein
MLVLAARTALQRSFVLRNNLGWSVTFCFSAKSKLEQIASFQGNGRTLQSTGGFGDITGLILA